MYSWKFVRAVCLALLLLPLAHLAYLMAMERMALIDPSPQAWSGDIQAYVQHDNAAQLPTNPLVVAGGKSARLWPELEDILAPMPVLMRGLGDATITDITFYVERLINFYRPSTLVVLPSSSEFHDRDDKSAREYVAALRDLTELIVFHQVTDHIYAISPIKTPHYPQDEIKIDKTLLLLQEWANSDERFEVLDPNPLFVDAKGKTKPEYFRRDGVNLNKRGYMRLSMLLQAQVQRDNPALFGLAP